MPSTLKNSGVAALRKGSCPLTFGGSGRPGTAAIGGMLCDREGRGLDHRHLRHARQPTHAFEGAGEHLVLVGHQSRADVETREEQVARFESEVLRAHVVQAPAEKPRAHDEHHRERRLDDEQCRLRAAAAGRHVAGAAAQRVGLRRTRKPRCDEGAHRGGCDESGRCDCGQEASIDRGIIGGQPGQQHHADRLGNPP